ncbi:MAG: sugar phosphate isomerase/epimerase [Melioribacteraceae bacterium]|nr:sugar phosphate isomerase/epimerase [Melioribacteraceae bacterium]
MDRRTFLKSAIGIAATSNLIACADLLGSKKELFQISLAEWSLHNTIFGEKLQSLGWSEMHKALREDSEKALSGTISNLDFPVVARQRFGIEAVEYVNQFFIDKAHDEKYLTKLNNIVKQEGVKNVLIMIDAEGSLGTSNVEERNIAIKNHLKWVDCAAFLGCHSIRVNTYGDGSEEEQMKNSADSLNQLAQYGDKQSINILVENHGGFSSDSNWLSKVMKLADHKRVGTLPDFGNFPDEADIYKEIKQLMPFAKGVSAKSSKFDENGNEVRIDYEKMMKIVLDAGYRGYVGIEFGGEREFEEDGIKKTKALLEKTKISLTKNYNL